MELFIQQNQLIASGLGFCVGFLLSLTGAGGAILSVPLLVFGLGLTVAQAGPIGLLAVTLSAGVSAALALREKILRYKAAMFMALFGLIFSPIGLWLAKQIPNEPLTIIFGIVLTYVATKMLLQANRELKGIAEPERKNPPCQLNQSIGKLIWTVPCARSLASAGGLAGFFSGLLGVGGGFIIVPSLKAVTDLPLRSIVATSLGVLTIVSFGGVVGASISGGMLWPIAIPFAGGALIGMLLGRQFSNKIKGPRLQQIFAIFAFSIAMAMLIKVLLTYIK
jgi:uncharacterized membrane protein YfcA